MKFNYQVKHNGVVYPAGADVPVKDEQKPRAEEIGSKEIEKVEKDPVKPKAGLKKKK